MRTPAHRIKRTFTRRDFLGLCSSASTVLLPAPLFGTEAEPLLREAAKQAAAIPFFSDYRILPQYRTHSPLAELIRKARQNVDDYPSEKYGREIESLFARWAAELRRKKGDLRALAAFLSPQLTAASPRPQALETIRDDSTLVIRRAKFSPEMSLGRDSFLESLPIFICVALRDTLRRVQSCRFAGRIGSPASHLDRNSLHASGHGAAAAPIPENRRMAN